MKHRKQITIIIAAVWVVLVLGWTILSVVGNGHSTYTAQSDSLTFSGNTYVSDNSYGFGAIYKINDAGNTEKIYITHRRNYIANWDVLKLATSSADGQIGGDIYAILRGGTSSDGYVPYRLVSYTEDLITDAMSISFYLHNGLTVTGLSYDNGVLYITGISASRQDVYIYQYNEYDMISIDGISSDEKEKLAGTAVELDENSVERNASGRLYSAAEYADGNLYSRLDDQEAQDDAYFAENTQAKTLFDNRDETFFQEMAEEGVSIIYIIAYCVIGVLIIVLVSRFITHRRRVTYRIILTEALILIGCVVLFFLAATETRRAATREYVRNETFALLLLGDNAPSDMNEEDFTTSANYATFYNNMQTISDRSDEMAEIVDVVVADTTSGNILMSVAGRGGDSVGYAYGDAAEELILSTDRTGEAEGSLGGKNIVLVSAQMSGSPQYKLLCVAKVLSPMAYVSTYEIALPIMVLIFFILVSAAAIALIVLDSMSMDSLGTALETLGNGGEVEDTPETAYGYDIKRMWASINEIGRNLKRANRDKFMTYEAYFRFAPKKIETIIGKNAITEVQIGDTKELKGTIAIIMTNTPPLSSERSVIEKNEFFSLAEKQSDETGGIFISAGTNLAAMRVLFLDNNKNSIRFGTDLAREAYANEYVTNPTIILHYGSFVYGVAGTDSLAYTFLTTEAAASLEKYVWWLGQLGVSMVITEPVKNRESGSWDIRYIGFILVNPNDRSQQIDLYEVLDATDSESRRGKKKTMRDFDKALKLFYERDFYFARTAFSDILREVPTDEISKWYLFECERLLNEAVPSDFAGDLHLDEG